MVKTFHAVLALAGLYLASSAAALAQSPRAPAAPRVVRQAPQAAPADFWVSIGGGAYTGKDYDVPPGSSRDPESFEVGGYSGHLSFNFAGDRTLLRTRSSWLTEYTSNTAEEVAIAFGLALGPGRKAYLTVGASRLTDVSDTQQSPTVGVPVELLLYPFRGLELMIHGNFNDDSNFIGFGVSGVIGRDRSP